MIDNYGEYEDFVKRITRIVPLLKTEQLKIMIAKYFSQDLGSADEVLLALQRSQAILLTVDGWAMTIGQYIKLTGDRFLRSRNTWLADSGELYKLPPMDDKCSKVDKPLSKSLWLVADMMPGSRDFVIACSPWTVAFTTDPKERKKDDGSIEKIPSRLYQITYIAKDYETSRTGLLASLPKISSNNAKDTIRRVCIMDNPDYSFKVPYIGFSHIVTIDHERENHYRVVETRKSDVRWKDDPYHE